MKTAAKKRNDTHSFHVSAFEVKSFDAATGEFSGYAAVFGNVDLLNDVCEPGCFAKTLEQWAARETFPRLYFCHWQLIGHITAMREDHHGLYVEGVFWLDKPDVAEAYCEISEAMPRVGMSFSYSATKHRVIDGVRRLDAVDLCDDITVTLDPVNTRTEVLEIKSADGERIAVPTIRATEGILRDAGFTRTTAKTLLASGYAALREAKSADDPKIRISLESLFDSLEKATGALNNGN